MTQNIRLWDMTRRPNIQIISTEKGAKGIENLFSKVRVDMFLNHGKGIDIKVQETFRTTNIHNQKRIPLCHAIFKLPKVQNK
jgi:hypothetical protein